MLSYTEEDESVLSKMEDFKRRVNDTDPSIFPTMIQEMIEKKEYHELARFGEAFKSRSTFSDTYEARLPRDIRVRDNYDLIVYMSLCSDLIAPSHITYESSIRYIREQIEKKALMVAEQSCIVHEQVDDLLMEVCIDEKEEMYENYIGYSNILYDEFGENMILLNKYVSRSELHELRIFVDSKHEIKGLKPYDLFRKLPSEEQVEIIRGKWDKANLFSRSPLYSVFLSMIYTKDVNPPHEICIRHPFLMVSYKYLDDLSSNIVAYTKNETVVRRIVNTYADNFGIDDSKLVTDCLNKLYIYSK